MTPAPELRPVRRRRARQADTGTDSPDMQDQAPRILGLLEGRVVAIEDRMDRNDITTAARLEAIELKLDKLADTLSQGMGGLHLAHWIGGALLAAVGFLVSHLWPERHG